MKKKLLSIALSIGLLFSMIMPCSVFAADPDPIASVTPAVTLELQSYNAVKVKWQAVTDATGYMIYYKENTNNSWEYPLTTSDTYTVIKDLKSNTKYDFKVQAYKRGNDGIKITSNESAVISTTTLIAPPTISSIKQYGISGATISWTDNNGDSEYEVFFKKSSESSWNSLGKTTNLTYTKTGLEYGKSYDFAVKAIKTYDGSSVTSDYSAKKSITIKIAKPIINSVSLSSYKTVKVNFNKVTGASGYRIYYRVVGTSKWTAAGTSTTFTTPKLLAGKKYEFKVRAYKIVGEQVSYSDYSNISYIYTLTKPSLSVKNMKNRVIRVTWTNLKGETGYQLVRKNNVTKKYTTVKEKQVRGAKTVVLNDTQMVKGRTYTYKVRAYKTVNGKKVYAPYSTIKTIKRT